MTGFTMLGAAAVISTALAGPAIAQGENHNPGYCMQFYPSVNCQAKGPGDPYTEHYRRELSYHDEWQYRDRAWHRGWRHSWDDE